MTNQNQMMDQQQATPRLSKRQRRAQGPNPSNTWQQQPRIKSAGARAKAYISYAGLDDEERKTASTGKKKNSPASIGPDGNSAGGRRAADLLDPQLDLHSPEVKFGRLLGGTDQRSRHHAVKMLQEYLRARSDISSGAGLSELDLLKLWKGLWYTLYMADKTPVQDKLSQVLAELMWCLSGTEEEDDYAGQVYCQMTDDGENGLLFEDQDGDTMEIIEEGRENGETEEKGDDGIGGEEDATDEGSMEDPEEKGETNDDEQRIKVLNEKHCRGAHLVSLYISTFLQTVRREWGNVDKHRVDKFYTAVRFMISEAYKYMSKRHWNIGIVRLFNDVLYEEGLCADTPGLTNGLRYHLIDICVSELAKVNQNAELPLTEATILDCLEPFFALAQKAVDKYVQRRVMDNVLLKFLNEYSFVSSVATIDDGEETEDDAKSLIFSQVHVGTVSKFIFEIASDNNTDERFRKSLYEMHKTFVRQIRAAGRDVDLNHYSEDEEEEAELDDGFPAKNTGDINESGLCEKVKVDGTEKKPNEKDDNATENEKQDATVRETHNAKMVHTPSAISANSKSEHADDITSDVTTHEPTPEKRKKRKKKKNKEDRAQAKDSDGAVAETPKKARDEDTNSNVTTPKAKVSSKKKRKIQDNEKKEFEPVSIIMNAKTPTTPQLKKKKKQKSPPSVDPRSMHSPDQVVSPASSDNEDGDADASASKRVSFGNMNHCKSHKASMKAIKSLDKDRWDTKSRTPDKGILRPKGSKSSEKKKRPPLATSSRKNRGRKRA